MAVKRFYRGSTTFQCNVCGRNTRDTGVQSFGNKICPQCYELAGIENDILDGNKTLEDYTEAVEQYLSEITAKGGDGSSWDTRFKRSDEVRS